MKNVSDAVSTEEPDLDIENDLDLEEFENVEFDANDIDLLGASTTELCDIVVSFRYLGIFKERALHAMQELSRRRSLGDDYNFEEYIELEFSKLPKLDSATSVFNIPVFGASK